MATDDRNKDLTFSAENSSDLGAEIERVTRTIHNLHLSRRRQGIISLLGVLIIIAILMVFLNNMNNLANSVAPQEVVTEMVANYSIITESPDLRKIGTDFNEVFVPAFKAQFAKKMAEDSPVFKQELTHAATDLREHFAKKLTVKSEDFAQKVMNQITERIKAKYPQMTPEEIADLQMALNEAVISEFNAQAKVEIDNLTQKLITFDSIVNEYKTLPEYAKMAKMDRHMLENAFVESALELWICHLNPEKAAKLANEEF